MLLSSFRSYAQQEPVRKGKQVFEQNQCVVCHGHDGSAPVDLRVRLDSLSDSKLKAFIKDPAAFGNRQMPSFNSLLSDADVDALVIFLRTLSDTAKKKRSAKGS